MILLDTSVVLAAQRRDHPHHDQARPWLEGLVTGDESFGVPSTVWVGFLRITTSRRVFAVPTPRAEAFAFVRAVAGQPGHVAVEPGPRHLERLEMVCAEGDAVGDLVPDAALVALAIEHGAAVASFDRDFARFPGLEWIMPVAQ